MLLKMMSSETETFSKEDDKHILSVFDEKLSVIYDFQD